MKAVIREFKHSVYIELEPETMLEQTMLVRMGINKVDATKVLVFANEGGNVTADIEVRKAKQSSNIVGRGKW